MQQQPAPPQQRGHYRKSTSSLEVLSERIDDVATFTAAAQTIVQEITTQGSITTARCTEIIQEKERVSDLLLYYLPGAMSGSQVFDKVTAVTDRLGVTRENTLFAQSICPDEINHEDGDLPQLFSHHFAHVFHLGGLAGVPFTGKTGFRAFKHHVPDNGHAFVLMAPHIGLSLNNELGKFSRYGQTHAGTACGAAVGAYTHVCAGHPIPDPVTNVDDRQMAYIIAEIAKRRTTTAIQPPPQQPTQSSGTTTDTTTTTTSTTTDSSSGGGTSSSSSTSTSSTSSSCSPHDKDLHNTEQTWLVQQTYDIAKHMLDHIIDVEFGGMDSTLIVLTGIQINMPRPFPDFFQPITLERYTKQSSAPGGTCNNDEKNGTTTTTTTTVMVVEDLFDQAFPES
jgi:hypothetical protein